MTSGFVALRLQSPSATFLRNNYVVTSALVIDDYSGCGTSFSGLCRPLHQIPLPPQFVSLPSNVTMGRLSRSADGGSVTFIGYNVSAGSALGPNDNLAASLVSLWPSGATTVRSISAANLGAGTADSGFDANCWASSATSDDGASNVFITGEKTASSLGLLYLPQLNGSNALNIQAVNGFKVSSSAGSFLFFLAAPERVVVLNSAQRVVNALSATQFLPAFSASVSAVIGR